MLTLAPIARACTGDVPLSEGSPRGPSPTGAPIWKSLLAAVVFLIAAVVVLTDIFWWSAERAAVRCCISQRLSPIC